MYRTMKVPFSASSPTIQKLFEVRVFVRLFGMIVYNLRAITTDLAVVG